MTTLQYAGYAFAFACTGIGAVCFAHAAETVFVIYLNYCR